VYSRLQDYLSRGRDRGLRPCLLDYTAHIFCGTSTSSLELIFCIENWLLVGRGAGCPGNSSCSTTNVGKFFSR
jgi:hypothetical protein